MKRRLGWGWWIFIPNSIPYTSSRSDAAAIDRFGCGDQPFLLSKVKLSTNPVNVNVDMLLCSFPGLHSYISVQDLLLREFYLIS